MVPFQKNQIGKRDIFLPPRLNAPEAQAVPSNSGRDGSSFCVVTAPLTYSPPISRPMHKLLGPWRKVPLFISRSEGKRQRKDGVSPIPKRPSTCFINIGTIQSGSHWRVEGSPKGN